MIVIILNDVPYGSERSYNGLRLALSLSKSGEEIRLYLMADAVSCAVDGQKTPDGYCNISRMIKGLLARGVPVHA